MSNTSRVTLSGLVSIEANDKIQINEKIREAKDIVDILDVIELFRRDYDLTGTSTKSLLISHITDTDSHDLNVPYDDQDMIDALYNEYIRKYGNIISRQEFIDALITVSSFATMEDYESGTNLHRVLSVNLASEILTNHITDPDAHVGLLARWFPGEPILSLPELSIQASVSSNKLTCIRPSGITCIGKDGYLVNYNEDEVPVDYTTGVPLIPMFKTYTNFASKLNSSISTGVNTSFLSTNNLNLLSPKGDRDYLIVNPITSSESYITETISSSSNKLSLCVFLMSTNNVINISLIKGTKVQDVIIDLKTNELLSRATTTDISRLIDNGSVTINQLPNKWFKIDITSNITFDSYRVNLPSASTITDDSTTVSTRLTNYSTSRKIALANVMAVNTSGNLVPPLVDNSITVASSKYYVNIEDPLNMHQSTVTMKGVLDLDNNGKLYSMYNDEETSIIAVNNKDTIQILTSSDDGSFLTEVISKSIVKDINDITSFVTSYGYGRQSYGFLGQIPHVFDYYNKDENGNRVLTIDELMTNLSGIMTNLGNNTPSLYANTTIMMERDTSDDSDDVIDSDTTFDDRDLSTEFTPKSINKIYIGCSQDDDSSLNGYLESLTIYGCHANLNNINYLLNQSIN